jgi:hypothetical protein
MRIILLYFVLLTSPSAYAFSLFNSTGIDMQSASLMNACQSAAEKAAIKYENLHNINQCATENSNIVENSIKLSGLALDKKGFVYEMFVESGCSRSVKIEVVVGPTRNGQACLVLSEPQVLGTVSN